MKYRVHKLSERTHGQTTRKHNGGGGGNISIRMDRLNTNAEKRTQSLTISTELQASIPYKK